MENVMEMQGVITELCSEAPAIESDLFSSHPTSNKWNYIVTP